MYNLRILRQSRLSREILSLYIRTRQDRLVNDRKNQNRCANCVHYISNMLILRTRCFLLVFIFFNDLKPTERLCVNREFAFRVTLLRSKTLVCFCSRYEFSIEMFRINNKPTESGVNFSETRTRQYYFVKRRVWKGQSRGMRFIQTYRALRKIYIFDRKLTLGCRVQ